MRITITINTDNAAFEDGNAGTEVARILRRLAAKLESDSLADYDGDRLKDINGNTVGSVEVAD